MTRRKAREIALQTLYQLDIANGEDVGKAEEAAEVSDDDRAFSALLVRGTRENIAAIDEVIGKCAEHWSIKRMAVVERNILRLAVYELCYQKETPYKVVIDEAVELAKKFGSEDSGGFINGILDRVCRMSPPALNLSAR